MYVGFYEGEMLVGEYKGMKVKDAKPIIKEEMIKNGQAAVYSEPAGKVIYALDTIFIYLTYTHTR